MKEEKDRRYSQRFHFDEGKVYCQENSTFRIFKQFSEPFDLNDLTKSGISFKTSKNVSTGDRVFLKIDIPGRQKIQIIGRVVWARPGNRRIPSAVHRLHSRKPSAVAGRRGVRIEQHNWSIPSLSAASMSLRSSASHVARLR